MPHYLHGDDFDDLVVGTLKDLGDKEPVQIAQANQDYEFYNQWMKKDKVTFDGGYGLQQAIWDKLSETASMGGINDPDDVVMTNFLTTITIPWRHAKTYWVYNRVLASMNAGKNQINNIIKVPRENAFLAQCELLDEKCLACPDTTNTDDPYGLAYWITNTEGTTTPAFVGYLPYGHTTIAGLTVSASSHPKYANYCGLYATISESDLLPKLRRAMREVQWKSPIGKDQFYGPQGNDFRMYCNNDTYDDLEDLLISRNDNLGSDLGATSAKGFAKFENVMTYYNHPVINIHAMDSWTGSANSATGKYPIFGVNHRSFVPVALSGEYFEESGPHATQSHNTKAMFVDTTFNIFCKNRRVNFRFDKS